MHTIMGNLWPNAKAAGTVPYRKKDFRGKKRMATNARYYEKSRKGGKRHF